MKHDWVESVLRIAAETPEDAVYQAHEWLKQAVRVQPGVLDFWTYGPGKMVNAPAVSED